MCAMSTNRYAPTLVGDLAHALEIDDARIGAGADGDHLRLALRAASFGEFVVVDALVVLAARRSGSTS